MIKAGRVCHVLFLSAGCILTHGAGMLPPDVVENIPVRELLRGKPVFVCVRCWYLVVLPSCAVNTTLCWSRVLEECELLTGRDPVSWWSSPRGWPVCFCRVGGELLQSHTHACWLSENALIATKGAGWICTWVTHRIWYRMSSQGSAGENTCS